MFKRFRPNPTVAAEASAPSELTKAKENYCSEIELMGRVSHLLRPKSGIDHYQHRDQSQNFELPEVTAIAPDGSEIRVHFQEVPPFKTGEKEIAITWRSSHSVSLRAQELGSVATTDMTPAVNDHIKTDEPVGVVTYQSHFNPSSGRHECVGRGYRGAKTEAVSWAVPTQLLIDNFDALADAAGVPREYAGPTADELLASQASPGELASLYRRVGTPFAVGMAR